MDKFHLVITGRRNTGKSSIVNTILQQDKAVVSPIAGTTTDPVKKSYEIPGVASVVLIDTAGTDDEGELGELRVKKTFETIRQADAALLVITGNRFGHFEEILTEEFQKLKLPFLIGPGTFTGATSGKTLAKIRYPGYRFLHLPG